MWCRGALGWGASSLSQKGDTALSLASAEGHVEIVRLALDERAEVNMANKVENKRTYTHVLNTLAHTDIHARALARTHAQSLAAKDVSARERVDRMSASSLFYFDVARKC